MRSDALASRAVVWPASFVVLFAAWLTPSDALAFCRTTTCDPQQEDCDPPAGSDCTTVGAALYWPNLCVGYHLQRDASPQVDFDTFTATTDKSFSTWTQVDCGDGEAPSVQLADLGPISCDQAEYNKRAGNANIVMFRNDAWPYSNATHTLALTTVTFNTQNAEIYDVDMEINSAQVELSTTDANVKYDLESIITHEAGHFLGLAHSSDPSATMYAKYKQGSITLRSLEPDDQAGICAVYPPARSAGACDTTPRHGLQDTCGDTPEQTDTGCATKALGSRRSASGLGALAAACLALLVARRRRPGR